MSTKQDEGWTRRRFLGRAALAGAGTLFGLRSEIIAAEPPPETTKLRAIQGPSGCQAPLHLAGELLRAEGFTDVQYVKIADTGKLPKVLAYGEADIGVTFVGPFILQVDAGDPAFLLAGVHVGCFELFGTDRVRSIRDLKGKTVAVSALGSPGHVFLSSMAAYVGLNPRKDINWVTLPFADSMRLLGEGKIDGFLGFPPQPQELRANKIGHVVVNTTLDQPWSQYFCCMVAGNREFVRKYPVAAKRALRAIMKQNNVCALEPERSAQLLVDKKIATRYDYTVQMMKDLPYSKWREYDPEDTVRFYALRLHEAGMIKSSPQKIIAQGTDWRFLRELKKELKA
jgi:NitT/TauT family transport system substrate-binding protein